MIQLTKMDKEVFFLNPLHIEQVQETPDTVVSLTNGKKLIVLDSARDLVEKVLAFWRASYQPAAEEAYLSRFQFRPREPK